MSDANTHDASDAAQPPVEPAAPEPTGLEPPAARYRATLRLIRSRLVDEVRSERKPWWKRTR